MPFVGGGGFHGQIQSASANTNRIYSVTSDAAGFQTATQGLINTDGLCGITLSVTQVSGVVGTGAIRLQIVPAGDAVTFNTPPTAIPALNQPVLVTFNHIASRACTVEATGSNVPGNPNIYRILFMAC
jgi:hypothetical protein